MLGTGAGKDVTIVDDGTQFLVRSRLKLGAGNRFGVFGNAHLATDGSRSTGVVPGDHFDPDTCLLAGCDGLDRLGARRVDDTDQSKKDQITFKIRDGQIAFVLRHLATGGGQDPEPLTAKRVDLFLPEGKVERLRRAARGTLFGTAAEQPVGGTLEQDAQTISRN